jgi:zinc protease
MNMKKLLLILPLFFFVSESFSQKPERSTPPQLGKAKNLQLPPLQKFSLQNGINVLLMEKHTTPLVQINMIIQTGTFDDPAGKEGLASFTMDLLDEGAGSLDALQLAEEIEFLGAEISTYSGNFSSGINTTTPVSKLDPAVKIISDLMLHPKFDETEIERLRKLRLNSLLQSFDEPSIIARRAFDKYLYDASIPYGRFATEQSVMSYSKADVVNFHKTNFVTGNTTFIIVGDVTSAIIKPILEKYFSGYTVTQSLKHPRPLPAQIKGRPVYVIDKPGAAQSVIRIGRIGTTRLAADHDNISVMNTILGGSFASRLNTNLREVHGYSYGAGSRFNFWNVPGPFFATASVQTDVTGPALSEFFVEFKKMRTSIPDNDLARGKNYDALSYAANFESNASTADEIADLVLYNLPDTYFNTYVEKVLAVNKKGVEAAAKKYIVPENMLVVIVGDRAKIEEGIKKLNLGKIAFLSIEDVLGKKPGL